MGREHAFAAMWVCIVVASASLPARADDDAEPDVTTKKCRLGKGHVGAVAVTRQPETCGSGGCGTRTTVTVHDKDDARLLTLTIDEGDFDVTDVPVGARCKGGIVEVYSESTPELVIPLRFDAKAERLRLVGPPPETDGWQRPPLNGDAARQRERIADMVDTLAAGGEGPNPGDAWADNNVGGIDKTTGGNIWALIARDRIAAGAWTRGEAILDTLEGKGENGGAPIKGVKRRVAEVRALLAAERRKTAPLVVAERRKIGKTLAAQKLPLEPGVEADMFWRNDELCVIQEETPRQRMRCYSPAGKRWGAAVPIARPASDGSRVKKVEASGRYVDQCLGSYNVTLAVAKEVPEDKINVCENSLGVEVDRLVAMIDGGKMLVLGGKQGFYVDHGLKPPEEIDGKRATELVRRSAGTILAGEGCCLFGRDGSLRKFGGQSEHSWDMRGAPPKGETWLPGPPLASPDQRWAVAQSIRDGHATLWLYRLTAAPTPAPAPAPGAAPPVAPAGK